MGKHGTGCLLAKREPVPEIHLNRQVRFPAAAHALLGKEEGDGKIGLFSLLGKLFRHRAGRNAALHIDGVIPFAGAPDMGRAQRTGLLQRRNMAVVGQIKPVLGHFHRGGSMLRAA